MEPRRPAFPLQDKIMLLVSATLLLCLSGAGAYAIQGRRELLEEQGLRRARTLLAGLTTNAREALLTERFSSLSLMVRKIYSEDRDVVSVRVMDRDGVDVVHSPVRPGEVDQVFREDVSAQNFLIGKVEITLRKGQVRAALDRATRFLLLTLLDIVLLVGFVVHLAVKGFVTRPLEQLMVATDEVAGGDFGRRTQLRTRDELGLLSEAFDQMAGSLERYRDEVEANRRQLEDRVEARTAELAAAQERTAAILENLPVSVLVVARDLVVTTSNAAAGDLTAAPAGDLVGRTCAALLDTPLCRHDCLLARARRGEPHLEETRLGAAETAVLLECSPLGDGGIVTVRDVSRLEQMREQIRRSGKLSSLGTLAAGLAHELNNPLGNVSTYAQLLEEGAGSPERAAKMIETIRGEAERASRIVGRLLTFARPTSGEMLPLSTRDTALHATELLRPVLARQGVELRAPPEDAPDAAVLGDAGQLHQVLVNLVLNGAQAAGEGGWVRLDVLPGDDEAGPGFRIADSGPGIDEHLRDQLFDPFFTTKEAGEGTGLGLSVCYGIIQDHGGTITLENHPEGGAQATVRLLPAPGGGPEDQQEATA